MNPRPSGYEFLSGGFAWCCLVPESAVYQGFCQIRVMVDMSGLRPVSARPLEDPLEVSRQICMLAAPKVAARTENLLRLDFLGSMTDNCLGR